VAKPGADVVVAMLTFEANYGGRSEIISFFGKSCLKLVQSLYCDGNASSNKEAVSEKRVNNANVPWDSVAIIGRPSLSKNTK
jgi:hypothetical protein